MPAKRSKPVPPGEAPPPEADPESLPLRLRPLTEETATKLGDALADLIREAEGVAPPPRRRR